MRRYLTIAAVVILLIGVGVAIYFFFFAKPAVTTTPGTTLPTAGQGAVPGQATTGTPSTTPGTPTAVSARLVKISAGPVVLGMVVVSKAGNASTSPETTVTYIERRSGNVFSYSSSLKTLTRTSNKTIPGIQSASWLPNASLAFVRYLSGDDFSTINTYGLPANGVGGFFLPQNLADISVSPTNILTLASGVNGSVASLLRTDGTGASQAFTTPLSSIRVSFAGKNQYLVYTKPSSSLPGNAYLVDKAGAFSRVAGPRSGLVALASPSGKWVLVSYALNAAMHMELVNTITNETLPLPVATIADKCAWAADDSVIYCGVPVDPSISATYPDDWYQGAAHFSDRLWKIQVVGRYAQLVLDFSKETKDSLDAVALATDAANATLVFVNKNDGSLWSYSL
ncbi:hypothetical protein HY415_02400 [Candidatus Kaiserbacteria bacterium]|nr:hypothetical protein [Candidatus Kaiserbacteria bacterium]